MLAPMSGVTDVGFRRAAASFGATYVVSEMVACEDFVDGAAEARLRAEAAGTVPHVVQLAGCDPYWMGEAARLAEAGGADVIDINMGCPAKRVVNGWAGSALMRDLDHAGRLIAATVEAVRVPVTLKMRLGWDDASLNAPELARRAEELGVKLVSVHGRTRSQFYKGEARWHAVRAVRSKVRVPVIVNGDVVDVDSARTALDASGADAVMIGRGALGRPWLVGEVAAALEGRSVPKPPPMAMAAAAVTHYQDLLRRMGPEIGLRHARKHLAAYAAEAMRRGSTAAPALGREMVTSTVSSTVERLLARCFETVPESHGADVEHAMTKGVAA